jgi:hypothetical protein
MIANADYVLSVIFLVTTGAILPFIDRLPRRLLLLTGSIVCCICHFTVAALMASYGHHVDSINGNTILRWKVDNNTAAKGIIAVSYIFVGFYGLTWAPIGLSMRVHIPRAMLIIPCRLDIQFGGLPSQISCSGSRLIRRNKLDLQL